jgi:hypothetical protein
MPIRPPACSFVNDYEVALLQKPVDSLRDVLDLPAAIDYFLVTELTKNPDGYRGSVKMHKDRGGALVMGPPWVREGADVCATGEVNTASQTTD